MFRKVMNVLRARGLSGLIAAILLRLNLAPPMRAVSFLEIAKLLQGKSGMEIGGLSQVFTAQGILPVYPVVGNLDNCNFGDRTVWEGNIREGMTFEFDRNKPAGRQFIAEATAMDAIPSANYDFVLSSHVLEHSANPVLALTEWIRLLKQDGLLVLLLPHKDGTFDHRRPVTSLQHLIDDFNAGMGEDDMTHMAEIMELHDLARDPEAGTREQFKARSEHNLENRCFHHHVFDTRLAVELVDHMGLQILAVEAIPPMHILVVARKIGPGSVADNAAYRSGSASCCRNSPFPTDRR